MSGGNQDYRLALEGCLFDQAPVRDQFACSFHAKEVADFPEGYRTAIVYLVHHQ
jgi:hypothetical protein